MAEILEQEQSTWAWLITGRTAPEDHYDWWKSYVDWQSNLSVFGLQPVKDYSPCTYFRYDPNKNQYRGKTLAIRNNKLTEVV